MARQLVTLRTIDNLLPIENADAIELAIIDGWQVVTKRGEFSVGDSCVFFEIDSWLPADDSRYEFLKKTGVKTAIDGKERIRLKTIKLRKQLSQGLALPVSNFPETVGKEGEDLSSLLDVIKWERPETKHANAKGNFPDCIHKTEECRIQNVYKSLVNTHKDVQFTPTLKLDGSSCTVAFLGDNQQDYWKGDEVVEVFEDGFNDRKVGEVAVCSRNLQLKEDYDNHFYKAASKCGVIEATKDLGLLGRNYAIQGEVLGPGIQGNKEEFPDFVMYVFSIFDIDAQEYLTFQDVAYICNLYDLLAVPTVGEERYPLQMSLEELLAYSDGTSINAKRREGVVWKSEDGSCSFKAISNQWLLKTGE